MLPQVGYGLLYDLYHPYFETKNDLKDLADTGLSPTKLRCLLFFHLTRPCALLRGLYFRCIKQCVDSGIISELGTSVVYDSFVHGSWLRIKKRTDEKFGSAADIGEHNWIAKYIAERYAWLENHSNQLLRKTVYRMKSFGQIMATGNWSLELPFVVRGVMIDKAMLMYTPSPRALSPEDESQPLLKLRAPYLKGHDVSALQKALAQKGIEVDMDGIFDPETKTAVIEFQKQAGLEPDGIVGPATRAELELFFIMNVLGTGR